MPTDLTRSRRIVRRTRASALVSTALIFLAIAACSSDGQPDVTASPAATATPALAAPTTTPTPTETPKPIPTAIGTPPSASPAFVASTGKTYFPPPPPRDSAPPANNAGIDRLYAPDLGVDHYIEVDNIIDNEMESPRDGSYAVGFYPDFDRPGTGGNAIFSAHETWNHFQGPFYQLVGAKVGEEIAVVMADGRNLRYRVISNTRYEVDTMPMAEILWPSKRPKGEEWLTMLTCGGRIVYNGNGFGEYLDRDVIVARRIQ